MTNDFEKFQYENNLKMLLAPLDELKLTDDQKVFLESFARQNSENVQKLTAIFLDLRMTTEKNVTKAYTNL
jgi:hypothetical protein